MRWSIVPIAEIVGRMWSGNEFVGDRANDVHLTNAMKRAATDKARGN